MRRTSALVACLVAALALTGCQGVGQTGDLNQLVGDGVTHEVAVADRGAPVSISGTTIQGAPLSFDSLRGKVAVVNIWWSGCGPCIAEMPMLVGIEKSYATGPDKGEVAFVGIDIRDNSTASAAAFERARGVDYPSLYDPASKTLIAFGKYAPYAPPSTLVLDRQGRVAALINGAIPSRDTLTTVVNDVLKESS